MNISLSQCALATHKRENDLPRCVYINQENPKKTQKCSKNTIFHSPYKDGRPNKNFYNPTFMTSDIISNKQFSPFKTCTPKKGIVFSQAQNKQRALYNQRMNRSQSFKNIAERIRQNSKSLKKRNENSKIQKTPSKQQRLRSTQRADQGKNFSKIINSTLKNELQKLLKFKEERQLKEYNRDPNERKFRKTIKKESEIPIYFQKEYKNPKYEQQKQEKRRSELKQWLGISKQLQLIKEQIKKEKYRQDVNMMRRNLQNYQAQNQQREFINRKNAQLLNRVLMQQIRTKERESAQQKKERGWRVF